MGNDPAIQKLLVQRMNWYPKPCHSGTGIRISSNPINRMLGHSSLVGGQEVLNGSFKITRSFLLTLIEPLVWFKLGNGGWLCEVIRHSGGLIHPRSLL